VPAWTPERLFALFPSLGAMRRRRGGMMSGGEQQMLTVARALMGNPRLVLLDEPAEGLAPKVVEDMARAILTMKQEGLSLLLSEQNLHFARLIADRAVVIDRGHVRFAGTLGELAANRALCSSYLSV
jgi:branched-chain amino acid transport system ATP-binding protein